VPYVTRARRWFGALLLGLLSITPARGQQGDQPGRDALWEACRNSKPAELIKACTALADMPGEARENRAIALYNRANARRGEGDFAAALEDYTAALGLRPEFQQALANRATIWLEKPDLDRALADVDAALRLNPRDAVALRTRAIVRIRQGNVAQALPDLEAAIAANPRYAGPYQTRCVILATGAAGRPDGAGALADCDAALQLAPRSIDALRGRGLALLRLARAGDAAAAFGQVLEVNPRDAVSLYGRALALRQAGADAGRVREAEAAAGGLDPQVAARFADWGLGPR
jgi:tetratricopeptide (TPR) repeat protein